MIRNDPLVVIDLSIVQLEFSSTNHNTTTTSQTEDDEQIRSEST